MILKALNKDLIDEVIKVSKEFNAVSEVGESIRAQ